MRQIFISYQHDDDESLKKELEKHLAPMLLLKRASAWSDRQLKPGAMLFEEIRQNIEQADIILLLISSSYLSSGACQDEMETALTRHRAGESITIPVIVRPCAWKMLPLGDILATPEDGKPISIAADRDVAWLNVVENLNDLISKWAPLREGDVEDKAPASPVGNAREAASSNNRWVYIKTENNELWSQLKTRLAEQLAADLDTNLPSGQEDNVRLWGEKILVDVKHPRFTSTKRVIIDDLSGYPGYPGYRLDIYPGSPLGLQVKPRNLRWLQDDAGGDYLGSQDGKAMLSIEDLSREIAIQAALTSWGKSPRFSGRRNKPLTAE